MHLSAVVVSVVAAVLSGGIFSLPRTSCISKLSGSRCSVDVHEVLMTFSSYLKNSHHHTLR